MKLFHKSFAVAIAVWALEGNTCAYLVEWSEMNKTFSMFPLLGSICR